MPPAAEKARLRGIDQAPSAHAGHALATQTFGVEPPVQLLRFAPARLGRASADGRVTPSRQRGGDALTLGIARLQRSSSGPIKAVEGGDPTAHSPAALRG
jgi:hypothetical protein